MCALQSMMLGRGSVGVAPKKQRRVFQGRLCFTFFKRYMVLHLRDKNTLEVCFHKAGQTEGLQITIIRSHCHLIFCDDSMCYALTLVYNRIFFLCDCHRLWKEWDWNIHVTVYRPIKCQLIHTHLTLILSCEWLISIQWNAYREFYWLCHPPNQILSLHL